MHEYHTSPILTMLPWTASALGGKELRARRKCPGAFCQAGVFEVCSLHLPDCRRGTNEWLLDGV